jgi:predicted metal-dependent hydrolase
MIHMDSVGPVLLERSSKARRLILTVRPFRTTRVAVPRGVTFQEAESFAVSRKGWIVKHLKEIRHIEQIYMEREKQGCQIDRQHAIKALTSRTEELASLHGFTFSRVTVRNQKTRWGSCSSANNISLNMKLLLLPEELRDFIILHELVHTRVKNHSRKFWDELLQVEPLAREYTMQIKKYNLRLL